MEQGANSGAGKDVIDARALSEFMGVSHGWVYNNMKNMPHRKVGNLYFFHKPTIVAWLAGNVPSEVKVDVEMSEEERDAAAKEFVNRKLQEA
jgi:hypothetical protein